MPTLKTTKEIKQAINKLSRYKQSVLKALVFCYTQTEDYDMLEVIDDMFLYEYRWRLFEHHTDSPILYEQYHLEEFVDHLYAIFNFNRELK